MAEDFTVVISTWQPFYNLAGSAAFTLAGLVFVAVSLKIDKVALAGEQGDLRNSHEKLSLTFWC